MRDAFWAAVAGVAVFIGGLVFLQSPLATSQGDPPFWNRVYILVGAPLLVAAILFFQLRAARRSKEAWQRVPAGTRMATTVAVVLILVAVNVTGLIITKRTFDEVQEALDCTPGPVLLVDTGSSEATLTAGSAVDNVLGERPSATTPPVSTEPIWNMTATGTWSGTLDVSLEVQDGGEWFHAATYPDVASGKQLSFDVANDRIDAFRFQIRATEPLDEDAKITLDWTTYHQERC